MLKLPPDHPQNWFRNAFVHFDGFVRTGTGGSTLASRVWYLRYSEQTIPLN